MTVRVPRRRPPRLLRWLLRGLLRDQQGQAMVESAIVIPLMTFLILGVIQLTMMQHARIMTEYAAFNAARAGIVWNADRIIMENAAIISLLPTYEGLFKQSDLSNPLQMLKRIAQRALLYQKYRRLPQAVDLLKSGTNKIIDALPISQSWKGKAGNEASKLLDTAEKLADQALRDAITKALGSSSDRMVQVEVKNPTLSAFGSRGDEIRFDDPKNRDQTRLTIEVRYLYMMRVPFANWVIHQAWLAAKAGQQLYGAVWSPQTQKGETGFRNTASPQSMYFADPLLTRLYAMGQQGVFMVPIRATYTMRMQSDPYKIGIEAAP